MKMLQKLYGWYGKKTVLGVTATIVILIFVGLSFGGPDNVEETKETLPTVRLTNATSLANTDTLELLGTVRSVSEVDITPERGGKVTRVNVTLGSEVRAGQIIAEIENASERASLLQAEGSYEAAEAAAASSNVGTKEAEIRLSEAKNGLVVTNNGVYTVAQNILINTFDTNFYAGANSAYPSLRINTLSYNEFLRNERIEFQAVLPKLQNSVRSVDSVATIENKTDYSITQLNRLLTINDIFLSVVNDLKNQKEFTDTQKAQINSDLKIARDTLVSTINNLERNVFALSAAEEALNRAQISASGGIVSVSEAQLKQALGSLRAAQASYAKTILRTPISGTVNSLSVSIGDYLNPAQVIASVANNGQLEVVTFVSEKEKDLLSIGDQVNINKTEVGTVSAISQAISASTGKIEVRIVTESQTLLNGESVRVSKISTTEVVEGPIRIPLTSVRFSGTKGVVFIIKNNFIEAVDVELGEIRGSLVEVKSGLERSTEFVLDARGRNVGDEVISEKI